VYVVVIVILDLNYLDVTGNIFVGDLCILFVLFVVNYAY